MDPKLELTRQWLTRAEDDLRLADLVLNDNEAVYWCAAFNAQQAVGKVTREPLIYHRRE